MNEIIPREARGIWKLLRASCLAGVNFTNILQAPFSYESFLSSFSVEKLRFDFFCRKDIGAKAAPKTLVKLTTGNKLVPSLNKNTASSQGSLHF